MTAVPGAGAAITLICDRCGDTEASNDLLVDPEVVWPTVTGRGWTGSPFATGPHWCTRCTQDQPPPPETRCHPSQEDSAPFDLSRHEDVNAVVLTPLTDLDDHSAPHLRPVVMDAVGSGRHVVVDLRAVHTIDPPGLSLLVHAHREARHHAVTLSLAAASRFVVTVLHTMRLDGVFPTFPDWQHAIDVLHHPDAEPSDRHRGQPPGPSPDREARNASGPMPAEHQPAARNRPVNTSSRGTSIERDGPSAALGGRR